MTSRMSHEIRILQLADRDTILQYERQKLLALEPDDMERQMLEWHASWRTEALEHYLPLGWSFSVLSDVVGSDGTRALEGYFLAQPQVFTRGLTQTLWIERIQFNSGEVLGTLLEVAYKLCREKHFQQLLVATSPGLHVAMSEAGPFYDLLSKFEKVDDGVIGIKTAKF